MFETDSESEPLVENTLDSVINRIGFGKGHYLAAVLAGTAVMADGMEITLLSILLVVLGDVWDLGFFQIAFMAATIFLGMILGALISSMLGDKHGRVIFLK